MSQREKLLQRLRGKPTDFTWSELERLLEGFGYVQEHGSSGSSRKFINEERKVMISMHQPHPRNVLKAYQVRDVLAHLKQEGYL